MKDFITAQGAASIFGVNITGNNFVTKSEVNSTVYPDLNTNNIYYYNQTSTEFLIEEAVTKKSSVQPPGPLVPPDEDIPVYTFTLVVEAPQSLYDAGFTVTVTSNDVPMGAISSSERDEITRELQKEISFYRPSGGYEDMLRLSVDTTVPFITYSPEFIDMTDVYTGGTVTMTITVENTNVEPMALSLDDEEVLLNDEENTEENTEEI